jgi:hypothetical protein
MAALFCAGFLVAGSAAAQGEIEVRSARINTKDPDVAARRMAGTQLDRAPVSSTRTVARFPTVVLGTASYQLAGTVNVSAPVAQMPVSSEGRIAAVDLLPAFVTGDSLLDIPENFVGDPTLSGTIDTGTLPGTVTTDSIRFNRPVNSPLFGVAGPGSSPGVAGPGAIPTQGLIVPGFTQGTQTTTGSQSGAPAPAAAPVTAGRGSLRLGGRF